MKSCSNLFSELFAVVFRVIDEKGKFFCPEEIAVCRDESYSKKKTINSGATAGLLPVTEHSKTDINIEI